MRAKFLGLPLLVLTITTGCFDEEVPNGSGGAEPHDGSSNYGDGYDDYDDNDDDYDDYDDYNAAPYVIDAYGGVSWDSYANDDVWTFEAVVGDPDGVYDVVEVWADVYDEYTGDLVDSFQLEDTGDPAFWSSEWLGYSTILDPFYDQYTVDIVAYDALGDYGYDTVWVEVYEEYEEPLNALPEVYDAYAGVFWDYAYDEEVWLFEASVDDADGVYDVVEVWADVYDEYTGELADSFELDSTDDPYFWTVEWFSADTYLDPYYDDYTVDFVGYDSLGDYDVLTVWADTY